jgi:hypothetical protein
VASRGGLSALALAEIAGGAVQAWSGITNASTATALRSILGGKPPQPGTGTEPITTTAEVTPAGTSPGGTGPAPAADLTGTAAANRALGRFMAAGYGWATGDEWAFLSTGWQEESGWSNTAQNGSWPDAYGIAQANPGTKYPQSGWPVSAGGSSRAAVQIAWGLSYIKSRYGSPTKVPGWSANGPLPGYVGY